MVEDMLRIAVPNKGRLADTAAQMLREAGYQQRRDDRSLVVTDEPNHVEFFYLRPRDIAVYVGEGTLEIGLTGRDLVADSHAPVVERMPLGFGESTLRLAAPPGRFDSVAALDGARVATSYPGIVSEFLAKQQVDARVVHLDGAVESAIRLGVADAIVDVVSTGTTMREAGLRVFGEPVLASEAVLITREDLPEPAGYAVFARRLHGVMVASSYVMMDYDILTDRVQEACALTPGIESPTVSPLQREGWSAVRAMVRHEDAHAVMDALYEIGARGILVTNIHACRL